MMKMALPGRWVRIDAMETPGRMKLFCNIHARRLSPDPAETAFASQQAVQAVGRFHASLPGYRPTPLQALNQLAQRLGVGGIWLKDESRRFDLKAFKILGASYAVCASLAKRLNMPSPLLFDAFRESGMRHRLSALTLLAASDGNHGAAVAWMAAQLGCRCRILLPRGTAACRYAAIQELGSEAVQVDGNYDVAVAQAAGEARQGQGLLIQDTVGESYEDEEIPRRVMQGYLTLFEEAFDQMAPISPSHVFIPCGVGSLAASLLAYLMEKFGAERPRLIVIEAAAADCYYRSMAAGGDSIVAVDGDLSTCMAGLACGVPSRLGWRILRRWADGFASCPDDVALEAMPQLAFPDPPDPPVESGQCGAVTLGCLQRLMQSRDHDGWPARHDIGPDAKILLFSTEGATDPESYRRAIGAHPERPVGKD
jgi:diaminopropionate ammonia-lyase